MLFLENTNREQAEKINLSFFLLKLWYIFEGTVRAKEKIKINWHEIETKSVLDLKALAWKQDWRSSDETFRVCVSSN